MAPRGSTTSVGACTGASGEGIGVEKGLAMDESTYKQKKSLPLQGATGIARVTRAHKQESRKFLCQRARDHTVLGYAKRSPLSITGSGPEAEMLRLCVPSMDASNR